MGGDGADVDETVGHLHRSVLVLTPALHDTIMNDCGTSGSEKLIVKHILIVKCNHDLRLCFIEAKRI